MNALFMYSTFELVLHVVENELISTLSHINYLIIMDQLHFS